LTLYGPVFKTQINGFPFVLQFIQYRVNNHVLVQPQAPGSGLLKLD
jgi:hypothetical protein